ncbi:toxin-antitoxin system HicB family antitoxin [Corynebacterium sp. 320]|uniref:Toxin-antitoxin system HicB family antitoxin n=1 Tax=Corynebacterium zhongnanshanii TaxID=2768834 RepID=A0ABQ6VC90_9CORY|nr:MULTISPECIES: toxin-antitoxin system HicB family antitoxin [Corynebacterium]KAB1502729.1 toxin-antitoxin system HicB family antitoxin [Corynebacterium sp. 320]KAB1550533.1 toxin-antitoxin system HicB family antitoxin [Corynebacterium sp. 319]KAB1554739.1 toxin-antitoxin system HicB family antitoxin [Corynebacterium sp. 321]KAB3519252.1 toxin-antitoxin system HicB family antitoxin [Corynebacterium zhongnanshanii]KAB3526392.1 toxin-antitoxin system HicB family antitoxin [Corynebacterium sp. 2
MPPASRIQRRTVRRTGGKTATDARAGVGQHSSTDARADVERRTVTDPRADSTNTRAEAEHYSYRVAWDPTHEQFLCTSVEFPDVRVLASDSEGALTRAQQDVARVLERAAATGADVPQPLSTRTYSGRLQVRLGEDLHRALAYEAAENGISLNQLILKKLAAG